MDIFKGMDILMFTDRFKTDDDCKAYLSSLRWADGFKCPKCGSTSEHHSQSPYIKRCGSCFTQVSSTSGTMFHKVKFGLRKAFYIVFMMGTSSKSCSARYFSKSLTINYKAALLFTKKVREVMKSSKNHPLQGKIEVDETVLGGNEEGKPGRSHGEKIALVVAIEKTIAEDGIKRAYAMPIDNYSNEELEKMFEKHIGLSAKVKTDKWSGYLPLASKGWNIEQEKSKGGENFELIHRFIMGLKGWIRGIYHSITRKYVQGYLDEYCYRFNRCNFKETAFHNLTKRMLDNETVTKNNFLLRT